MFAKLLKHEIKATAGLVGLLSLAALAVGILGGFLIRMNMNAPAMMEAYEALSIISSVALPFIFLSLIGYAFGCEIYLAVQFYRRKFTDQGYLTFTLPTRSWQIYLSSLLNIMLWSMVIILVVIVAFICIFVIGIYDTVVWNMMAEQVPDITQELELAFTELETGNPIYYILEFIASNVLLLTSITLGCVLAKKHKVLGSIGAYYAVSMLIGAVNSWASGLILDSPDPRMDLYFLVSAAISAVVAVGGSLLSIWLMDKKLNLP